MSEHTSVTVAEGSGEGVSEAAALAADAADVVEAAGRFRIYLGAAAGVGKTYDMPTVWETTERILVAVTEAKGTDVLLRRAARIASRVKGELDVVHVAPGDAVRSGDQRPLERLRQLATDVGARWHEMHDGPAQAIVKFAREHQITQIVIGSSQRSRWQELTGGGSNVMRIIREATGAGIDVHVIARHELPSANA